MAGPISVDALEGPKRDIKAASIFQRQAPRIAQACAEAHYAQTVIAEVSPDLRFRGIAVILTKELSQYMGELDENGWTLVFSSSESLEEIVERCMKMERNARRRSEVMQKWLNKHQ
jgi:hypothetical protein